MRCSIPVLISLAACARPPAPVTATAPVAPAAVAPAAVAEATDAPALGDGASVYVRGDAAVRWRADGPPIVFEPRTARPPTALRVVEETPTALRVRESTYPGSYLDVWVDKKDLLAAIARDTLAVPVGVAAAPRRLALRRGMAVEVLERRGDQARVRVVDERVEATADVPASAIGYRADDEWRYHATEGSHLARDGSVVRSGPDDRAAPVLRLRSAAVVTRRADHGRWAEIDVEMAHVHGRGFVLTADLADLPPARFADGLFTDRDDASGDHDHAAAPDGVSLAAGTCVRDRPDGDVIGVITEDDEFVTSAAGVAGWAWLRNVMPWGEVPVAVRTDGADRCPIDD